VWTSSNKGQQIVFPGGGMESEPLNVNANGMLTLYVEWRSITHGSENLELVDANTGVVQDTLVFHSFQSIVIGFSGDTFLSSFPSLGISEPYLDQAVYNIAVDFYEEGYDSYYYDVGVHGITAAAGFSGPAYNEAANAIINRNVQNIAIWGWSHGGGATNLLANRLELDAARGILPRTFSFAATAYIDAVRYDGAQTFNPAAEGFRPLSQFGIFQPHANWYQTTRQLLPPYTDALPFGGTSVPGSTIDQNLTEEVIAMSGINHRDIAEIVAGIRSNLPGPLPKLLVDFIKQNMSIR